MTPPAHGELFDRHGVALYRLACCVIGPGAEAESVVVDVMSAACSRTRDAADLPRSELARWVVHVGRDRACSAGRGVPLDKAAWALCVHGGCGTREAAAVLGVSEERVNALITRALTPPPAAEGTPTTTPGSETGA